MPILDLCSKNLIFLEKDSTFQYAAHLMKEHHVGGIVVVDSKNNNQPIGILTDRDIVIQVIAEEKPHTTRVGDIMSTHVISVSSESGVAEAISKMEDEGVRRLVIIDASGKAVGLLSSDDLIPLLAEEIYGLGKLVQKQTDLERAKVRSGRIFST